MQAQLTNDDAEVLRYLAEKYHEAEFHVQFRSIPAVQKMPADVQRQTRIKLGKYGLIKRVTNESVEITEQGQNEVDRIDNPPPKDHWADTLIWFRSKRWSIPVMVLLVGLPALVGYGHGG